MEIWRQIPGYEGFYEASTEGRIRSVDRLCNNGSRGMSVTPGKVLKFHGKIAGEGRRIKYPIVCLAKHGVHEHTYVHSFMARTFLGPRPPGMVICHNDGDSMNSRPDNLRYDTPTNNHKDKYKHGTSQSSLLKVPGATLRAILVETDSMTVPDIAQRHGLTRTNVYTVIAAERVRRAMLPDWDAAYSQRARG